MKHALVAFNLCNQTLINTLRISLYSNHFQNYFEIPDTSEMKKLINDKYLNMEITLQVYHSKILKNFHKTK
jgi:hypothetical protein